MIGLHTDLRNRHEVDKVNRYILKRGFVGPLFHHTVLSQLPTDRWGLSFWVTYGPRPHPKLGHGWARVLAYVRSEEDDRFHEGWTVGVFRTVESAQAYAAYLRFVYDQR